MHYQILSFIISVLLLTSCGGSGSEGGAPSAKNDIHPKLSDAIPKASMRDAAIEQQLVETFNTYGWQEVFKAAVITSDEFNYKKSPAGIITDRTLTVLMLAVNPDGTCRYQDFTVISPKGEGGKYGKFNRYSTGGYNDCPCDGLK